MVFFPVSNRTTSLHGDCAAQSNKYLIVLLDLPAAFDTLDYLIERLRSYFNFSGTALQRFSSYLSGLSQRVIFSESISSPRCLEYGHP